ncbi:hypothetical protein PENSUB_10384 [Penicillium subrubescens]|uniref:Xylanolytic transcriptional activator regulatory domain-containing protein n=1 Tax=Penicillium subrubescens TaxID=1316194 RepID=A0A1Q5T9X0_9EURO|nr:hypothetical protein PENSUB_10384 [Penicillium subrubescens]
MREFRAYVPEERVAKSDFQELIGRSRYMERILKRTIEGIRLDTKSLAKLADALDVDGDSAGVVGSDAQEVEGLVMDDEACTMDPANEPKMGWDFPRAHQLRPGRDHLAAAISCCPPRPIAEFLARNFFKYAETHYFFIGRSWFFERMNLLYGDPSTFAKKGGEVIISILLTVFAIGSQYAHLESSTQNSTGTSSQNFSEEDIGATFYQQAIRLLPEIIELSSLESVQACLLFGYYALPVDTSGLGYIYINLAIRLGMQNGMHRKCKNDAFSATMVEARNRVWWTAYLLERTDVDAALPIYRSDLALDDTRTSVARAEASIQLIHFLEDIFRDVSNLRTCHKQQISKIISHLLTSKAALKEWWSSLPQEIVSSSLQPIAQLRSVMHLQLEYCLVRMFIGRPFLLKKNISESLNNSPADSEPSVADRNATSDSTSFKYSLSRKDLIDDCIEAATEALGILQELRDSGSGLARASYIEYSSCRASLLVLIAYSIQNFSEQFRNLLYKGLDMIREMSAAGESAQSEVSLIETLERALARLHAGVQQSQQGSMTLSERPISDYETFKHWGARLRKGDMLEAANFAADSSPAQPDDVGPLTGQSSGFYSHSYGRIMDMDCSQASLSMSDRDMGMLGALDPIIEIPLFGAENTSPSAAWPTWTETQVLEQFLMNPEYGAAQSMDMNRH